MNTNIHFWSNLARLFLEWEMFQKKFVEKIKTHISSSSSAAAAQHHYVPEGLGVFPVPWSSRWSWSLQLFLGRPIFLSLLVSTVLLVLVACLCPSMGEEKGVYRVLVGKPEGRRPLGRPSRRWVDNIRMDLQEVVCGGMDWIYFA